MGYSVSQSLLTQSSKPCLWPSALCKLHQVVDLGSVEVWPIQRKGQYDEEAQNKWKTTQLWGSKLWCSEALMYWVTNCSFKACSEFHAASFFVKGSTCLKVQSWTVGYWAVRQHNCRSCSVSVLTIKVIMISSDWRILIIRWSCLKNWTEHSPQQMSTLIFHVWCLASSISHYLMHQRCSDGHGAEIPS